MEAEERLVRNKYDFQIIKRYERNDGTITFRVKYPTALFSSGSHALIDADKTQEEFEQAIKNYSKARRRWQQRWVVYASHNNSLKRKDAHFDGNRLIEVAFQQIAEQEKIPVEDVVKSNEKNSLESLTNEAEILYKRAETIKDFLKEKLDWFRNEMEKTENTPIANVHQVKVLCTVWTDIQIDKEKKIIRIKGYDYVRVNGSIVSKMPTDDTWREYKPLYENWVSFQEHSKEEHKSNKEVLGWLNYRSYKILNEEMEKANLDKEKEILSQAIKELEALYRKQNLNAPDLKMELQINQMEQKYFSDSEKMREEIEQAKWDNLKYVAIADLEKMESEKVKIEIARKNSHIDLLSDKFKSSAEQSYNFIIGYVKCVEKMNMVSPALEDLEKQSMQSKSSWSRRLKDPIFLAELKKELKKKQSGKYSKSDDTKNRWKLSEQIIDDKINSLPMRKDALNKKTVQYKDERKTKSPYDDIDDAYKESIE